MKSEAYYFEVKTIFEQERESALTACNFLFIGTRNFQDKKNRQHQTFL